MGHSGIVESSPVQSSLVWRVSGPLTMNDDFLLPQRILAGVFGEDFGTFAREKSVPASETESLTDCPFWISTARLRRLREFQRHQKT